MESEPKSQQQQKSPQYGSKQSKQSKPSKPSIKKVPETSCWRGISRSCAWRSGYCDVYE